MEKRKKEILVDTLGNVTFSLIASAITDYSSGLRGMGILASRSYGTAINIPTGGPYGKWRNYVYRNFKTTDRSTKIKKGLTEFVAFNSFQTPLYTTVLTVGSLFSNLLKGELKVDYENVLTGTVILTTISPLVGPLMGLYMEGVRKIFGIKSAPKQARESLENKIC